MFILNFHGTYLFSFSYCLSLFTYDCEYRMNAQIHKITYSITYHMTI